MLKVYSFRGGSWFSDVPIQDNRICVGLHYVQGPVRDMYINESNHFCIKIDGEWKEYSPDYVSKEEVPGAVPGSIWVEGIESEQTKLLWVGTDQHIRHILVEVTPGPRGADGNYHPIPPAPEKKRGFWGRLLGL